jgi:hypothetical protein
MSKPNAANPESGTRPVAGKSNECDGALTDAPTPTPEKVRDAEADEGATLRAVKRQVEDADGIPNGNPKAQVTGLFRES